ncbi:hypothetical protein ERJ75_000688600 [Trypanosoma vivax]|nr:hypothetical protein ERJ75_000688600 [Trypanosoma vivax]
MSTASFKCVFISLSELFPRARLVVPPRLLGAALARGLVVLPAVVGRSACGCNAQHPPLLTACASKRHSPHPSQCAAAALLGRARAHAASLLLFGVRARSRSRCVSFAIAYCPCLLLHPHGRAQRVPAAPLTCVPQSPRCCPRCAAANVAASLARPARRGAAAATFVSAALLRLASVAPPVEPVAGASLRGRRTGSEAVSGSPRARCAVASGRALLAGCARCLPQLCGRYSALRDQRAACEGNAGARGTASPPSIVIRGRRGRLKVAAKSTGASAARSLFGSRRTAVRASAPTEAVGDGNRQPPRQAGHAREAALRRRLTPATPNAPRTARGSAQLARGNGHCRTPAWPRPGEDRASGGFASGEHRCVVRELARADATVLRVERTRGTQRRARRPPWHRSVGTANTCAQREGQRHAPR